MVKMGGSFEQFFDSVREETLNGTKLPNWRGELYFELHRGTYTSQADIKRGNRKSEILLREAELAATRASLVNPSYEYPKKEFDAAWEDLLLCQFHDVLPGSGIAMIYEDAREKYAKIAKNIGAVLKNAYEILYPGSVALSEAQQPGHIFAVNTMNGYPRREVVACKVNPVVKTSSAQLSGDKAFMLMESGVGDELIASPKGLYAETKPVSIQQTGDSFEMANSSIRLTVSEGRITSLYDIAADKELIAPGETGGMVIMEDHPNYWDAWDVDSFHLEKQTHLKFGSVSILANGPLRATLGATTVLKGGSRIEVEISIDAIPASLRADARSLVQFSAMVDWREKHQFLKFELPVDIHSDFATYETQFGTVARPTHRNTSWDAAKFEVCGHKFADLSEYGYGVAILNESKYGYSTDGNIMRLSLLRAPTMPDLDCDMGTHQFSWAIYPHLGTLTESDVSQVAYAFNNPLHMRYSSSPQVASHSMASTTPFTVTNAIKGPYGGITGAPNVTLETIKRGEDDEADKRTVVLRLFESYGGAAKVKLGVKGLTIVKAQLVNILEEHIEDVKMHSGLTGGDEVSINLNLRGYEIKTVKLTLGKASKKRTDSQGSWVKIW